MSAPTNVQPSHAPLAARPRPKAARRAVIVQCDRCKVTGTGAHNGRVVRTVSLAATNIAPGDWRHRDCGGRLVAFDIVSAP